MENSHFQWENPLFLWSFSIAMLNYQRVNSWLMVFRMVISQYSGDWMNSDETLSKVNHYTPFGNSMRSLALLRLVGGKDFWKSVRAASSSSWCFGSWNIDMFTCVLVGSEFPWCVSSIGNWIVLGFPLLKFGDVVVLKWWGGLVARGSFFPF